MIMSNIRTSWRIQLITCINKCKQQSKHAMIFSTVFYAVTMIIHLKNTITVGLLYKQVDNLLTDV